MDGLERLALNPVADKGIAGVLLCNPTPFPVTIRPELPSAWFQPSEPSTERTYRASRMFYDGRPWLSGYPGEDSRAFGPVELEPFTWRSLPLESLPEAGQGRTVIHEIETSSVERRELNFAPESPA